MTRLSTLFWPVLAASPWLASPVCSWPLEQIVFTTGNGTDLGRNSLNEVREALIASQIIPTVIDDFEPLFALDVEWKKQGADLGNTIKVKKVKKEPNFSLRLSQDGSSTHCNSNMTFVVTLTDPDAPSRDNPKWGEMCHFIATGLPLSTSDGESCSELHLSNLRDIMPYKPPGPPPKTGKHRYVFLVFAPSNGTTGALYPSKPADRQHWGTGKEGHGVRDWAYENGFLPIAANFIYAENKKQ